MRIAFKIMYILYGWCPAGPTGGRRRRRLATDPTPNQGERGRSGPAVGRDCGWLAGTAPNRADWLATVCVIAKSRSSRSGHLVYICKCVFGFLLS